jgi:hypothetical protein
MADRKTALPFAAYSAFERSGYRFAPSETAQSRPKAPCEREAETVIG